MVNGENKLCQTVFKSNHTPKINQNTFQTKIFPQNLLFLMKMNENNKRAAPFFILCQTYIQLFLEGLNSSTLNDYLTNLEWLLCFKINLLFFGFLSPVPKSFTHFLIFFENQFLSKLHSFISSKQISEKMKCFLFVLGLVNSSIHTHLALMGFLFPEQKMKKISYCEDKLILDLNSSSIDTQKMYFSFQNKVERKLLPKNLRGTNLYEILSFFFFL